MEQRVTAKRELHPVGAGRMTDSKEDLCFFNKYIYNIKKKIILIIKCYTDLSISIRFIIKKNYLDTYFLLLAYRDLSTAQNNIDYLR